MSTNNPPISQKLKLWIIPLSMLAVGFIAALLYSRALNFSFFNDDPTGHFAWMESRSFLDFFNNSAEYGYYRPIVFVILQGLVHLFSYNTVPFHALLLLLHGANTAMLWLLAYRLGKNQAYAWAAALLFATVPFLYEAVAYVASLTHPLLLFWLLLTILLYQNGRMAAIGNKKRSVVFYLAAGLTLTLGLFTHENGLLIPLALVGVEWAERPPQGLVESIKRPFLPYFIPAALFFVLWLTIPKTSEQNLPALQDLFSNLVPFMQTKVYPLLPLFQLTAENVTALLLLVLSTLLAMLAIAFYARAVRLWLFALLWFLASTIPALLFLSPAYLYGSPRLHYLPAVGFALFWALPVLALTKLSFAKTWANAARGLVGALYLLLIILPPLPFIRCQMDFYAAATTITSEMVQVAREAPAAESLRLVNIPFFFSSYASHPQGCANPYPWTPVGAVVMPPYASARDFVRFNGGPDRAVTSVTMPEYGPGWATAGETIPVDRLREYASEDAVYVFDLLSGSFFNLSSAWQPQQEVVERPLAVFDNQYQLLEAISNLSPDNQQVSTTLRWQVLHATAEPTVVFLHLYDQSGALVGQHDSPPGAGFVPISSQERGDILSSVHTINLEEPLSPGTYSLKAGLYHPANGQRLFAQTEDGPLVNDAYLITNLTIP